jgi:hypothetical protein
MTSDAGDKYITTQALVAPVIENDGNF